MLIFCFILLTFSVSLTAEEAWTEGRYPHERSRIEIPFEKETERHSTNRMLKINISSSWPVFQNKNSFLEMVNEKLISKAKQVFLEFIQRCEKEENDLDEEANSVDFDKRDISYSLTPTYATSSLVSVFGELYRYGDGMLHGCSYYTSHNYWFDGKEIQEISLSSLFLSDKNFADFLTQFCLTSLKTERVGYCTPDPEGHIPVEITIDDIQVFTLSKSGLTITFRPYHVGGWADGPYSITIPFESLKFIIDPQGPLREFL